MIRLYQSFSVKPGYKKKWQQKITCQIPLKKVLGEYCLKGLILLSVCPTVFFDDLIWFAPQALQKGGALIKKKKRHVKRSEMRCIILTRSIILLRCCPV
jgi:hypothetical protein